MPAQQLGQEPQRRSAIARLGDNGFQHLALMVDGAPEVMGPPIDPHEDLVEVPPPSARPEAIDPPLSDLGGEHRAESVPTVAYSLMADFDAPLAQQVLDVPERKREADVQHHRQADDLGTGLEVAERVRRGHAARLEPPPAPLKRFF